MDFKVIITINGKGFWEQENGIFLQAHEVLAWISERFGQWNNFHPNCTFLVEITKVPSEGETLGVVAGDELSIAELLR